MAKTSDNDPRGAAGRRASIDPDTLSEWSRRIFTAYCERVASLGYFAATHCKAAALRMLRFFEAQGAGCPGDISYHMVAQHTRGATASDLHGIGILSSLIGSETGRPLLRLAASRRRAARLIDVRVDKDGWDPPSVGIPAKEFREIAGRILDYRKANGYSKSVAQQTVYETDELSLFLEANVLPFSLGTAKSWCLLLRDRFGKDIYRAWALVHWVDAVRRGHDPSEPLTFYIVRRRKEAPAWARPSLEDYIQYRRREVLAKSTVTQIRLNVTRFCLYADAHGCKDIQSITRDLIKGFNAKDSHRTNASKNACNCKISGWLRWLFHSGLISQDLAPALPTVSALQDRPVKTLGKEDQAAFDRYCADQGSGRTTRYRDIALVKLMRYVGMRAGEAASLRFSCIHFADRFVSFIQSKTQKASTRPVPVHVLNSIVDYIENERPRPQEKTDFVFLSTHAPHRPVTTSACTHAFLKIFGRSDTHTARRTFSSELMANGSDPSLIAHTIGHSSNGTLRRYLNTDEERMVKCSIPLGELLDYQGGLM